MKAIANKVINTILNLKDNFSKGLKSATSSTASFKKQMKVAENAGTKMRSTFKNTFSSIASSASVLGTISLGAIGVGATKAFANFEQSVANVNATLGKSSTPQVLESYKKKSIELSDTMSKSSKEIMDGFNYLALAGWSAEDSIANIGSVVKSSVVSGMDLATCSDKITDSLSALGLQAKDTTTYTNTLALAQTKGNATIENLLDSYLSVGGTMKNFNIPLNESSAILDKLADRGLKGAEAGNSLSAIMVNLMGKTGSAKQALSNLNISLFDSSGNVRNMTEFLFDLKGKLQALTPEQRNTAIALIAGKNQLDAFNKLMDGTDENLVKLSEDLKDTNGALDEAAKTIDNTLIGNFKKLKNIISNTGIEIVGKFAPQLNGFLEGLQTKVKNIRPVIENFIQKVLDTVPKVINILKEMSPIIGGIIGGLASFMIITKITSSAKNFTKIFEKFAILTSPIGLACIAIGSLVAIIIHLMNTNEEFRNNMEHCYQRIKTQVIFAIESIQFKLREMKETYGSVGEYIKSKMPLIASIGGIVGGLLAFKALSPFSGIINKIGLSFGKSLIPMFSFKNILLSIKNIPGMLLAPINLLKNGIVSLQRTFVLAKAFLPGILSGGFSKIGIVFKSLLHPITLLKKGFTIIRTALMAVVTPVGIVIAVIGALVAGFIYCWNTNSDFRDKMIEAWNSISSAIVNIVGIVVGWISELASFLIGFYTEHQSQIDGLLNAVLNTIGVVIEQIVSIITGIVEIISGIFQVIDGLIHGDWSEMWEGCKTIFKGAIDAITGWWDGLREIFSHPLKAMINVFKHDSGSDEETTNEVAHNATGTSYFRGGLTTVNENSGKELIRLPSGTQIVPGDKTKKIMNGTNNVPPVTVIVQGNIIGNKEYADYLGNHILSEIKLGMLNI